MFKSKDRYPDPDIAAKRKKWASRIGATVLIAGAGTLGFFEIDNGRATPGAQLPNTAGVIDNLPINGPQIDIAEKAHLHDVITKNPQIKSISIERGQFDPSKDYESEVATASVKIHLKNGLVISETNTHSDSSLNQTDPRNETVNLEEAINNAVETGLDHLSSK